MRPPDPPEQSRSQGGLFTVRQARTTGLSAYRIRGLISSGLWVPVVGDVLAVAGTTLRRRDRFAAAALAVGGVVSHHSAAELWDMPVTRDGLMHVSVAARRHPSVAGIRLHRRPVGTDDEVRLGHARVTSRLRTLTDCLGALPMPAALRLLDHSMRSGWMSLGLLQQRVRAAKGQHGVRQLTKLLDEAGSGSWSQAERVLHRLLEKAGIEGWAPNAPVPLGDGTTAYVDVWFPERMLAIEVDGRAWHVDAEQFQRDRSRQNRLVLRGCTVLRFTWADLVGDPGGVLDAVRAALSTQTYGGVRQ